MWFPSVKTKEIFGSEFSDSGSTKDRRREFLSQGSPQAPFGQVFQQPTQDVAKCAPRWRIFGAGRLRKVTS